MAGPMSNKQYKNITLVKFVPHTNRITWHKIGAWRPGPKHVFCSCTLQAYEPINNLINLRKDKL